MSITPPPSLARLHTDDRGNIGVLMLFAIWAVVGVLALVWNTGEVSTRKQYLQTAADSSAHATATWVSRTANLITAQNMVICQDASMETIWRSVPPTDTSVRKRLEDELAEVEALLAGGQATADQLRSRMLTQLENVDQEYAQVSGALANVSGAARGQSFSDAKAGQDFLNSIRQANAGLGWVQNTYVGGAGPGDAQWPGPPGPGGQGLRQLVEQWSPPLNQAPILQAIIDSLQQQLAVLGQFESQSAAGVSQPVDQIAAQHEAEVFANEQAMAQQLTDTISQQLQKQTDFYNLRLTLATPKSDQGASASGPAQVKPPVINAADVPTQDHFDSIRGETVMIDPMNVHVDNRDNGNNGNNGDNSANDPLDSRILYPDVDAPVPPDVLAEFPRLPPAFTIKCSPGQGWGHLYCPPLHRYFRERFTKDRVTLGKYMQQIDQLRQQLAILLRQLRGLGKNDNITGLPGQITDPVPDAQGNNAMIDVLPRLTAPAGASDDLRAAVTLYNRHGGAYTGAVRGLAGALSSWARQYDRFTVPFANSTWTFNTDASAGLVLHNLGVNKQFMVLATYNLRPIPDWAQAGMRTSAEASIKDQIIAGNMPGVTQTILNAMVAANPGSAGGGYLDTSAQGNYLRAYYSPQASALAYQLVSETAAQVAPQIAAEWVARPWAYEITPPDQSVPPSTGMGKDDRQKYFTVLTAAAPTDQNTPKLFLQKLPLLGITDPPKLLAEAQAETFNWMEFNANYGGNERFDEVTWNSVGGANGETAEGNLWRESAEFVAAPVPWRLATVGGWTWNPRLSLTDALGPAIENNPEFKSFFEEAGISGTDAQALEKVTLH